MPLVRRIKWSAIVEAIDGPGRARDLYHPITYVFSNGRVFRDSGPNGPPRPQPDEDNGEQGET